MIASVLIRLMTRQSSSISSGCAIWLAIKFAPIFATVSKSIVSDMFFPTVGCVEAPTIGKTGAGNSPTYPAGGAA